MTEIAQLAFIEFLEYLVGNLVPIIGAVAALGALWNSSKNAKLTKEVDKKADHITVLTNSTLTAANDRIAKLEGIINEMVGKQDEVTPLGDDNS